MGPEPRALLPRSTLLPLGGSERRSSLRQPGDRTAGHRTRAAPGASECDRLDLPVDGPLRPDLAALPRHPPFAGPPLPRRAPAQPVHPGQPDVPDEPAELALSEVVAVRRTEGVEAMLRDRGGEARRREDRVDHIPKPLGQLGCDVRLSGLRVVAGLTGARFLRAEGALIEEEELEVPAPSHAAVQPVTGCVPDRRVVAEGAYAVGIEDLAREQSVLGGREVVDELVVVPV